MIGESSVRLPSTFSGRVVCIIAALALPLLVPLPRAAAEPGPSNRTAPAHQQAELDELERLLPDGPDVRGHWRVRRTDSGPTLTWHSPGPIPVTDSPPEWRVSGAWVATPWVSPDGRRLSAPLSRVPARSLAELEVWVGLWRLDVRQQSPAGTTSQPTLGTSDARPVAAPDPALAGPYDVAEFEYTAAGLPWPDFGVPMEVLGHVALPAERNRAPLVLFLHGRHIWCYGPEWDGRWPCKEGTQPVPSYLGYLYLQRMLASQGFATVSISANAINSQDGNTLDGGAGARSALIRHHLSLLARWNAEPDRPGFYQRLDMTRVVLVGHSRGGEGANQAVIDSAGASDYVIAGQVLIAPTDFGFQTAPYTPTELLLGYCDGDVSDLQGQRFVDAARELAPDDPSLRSSVLLMGANHNYFNTQWTPGLSAAPSQDDWWDDQDEVCGSAGSQRLAAAQQRRAARTFVAAGVHAFADRSRGAALAYLDAGGPVSVPAAQAVAHVAAVGGRRAVVDVESGARPAGGAARCLAGYAFATPGNQTSPPLCGSSRVYRQPHWAAADPSPPSVLAAAAGAGLPSDLELTWSSTGWAGGYQLDGPLDLGGRAFLDLRIVVGGQLPVPVQVELASGDRHWIGPSRTLTPLPGTGMLRTRWAQTLRLDVGEVRSQVDLTHIDAISLHPLTSRGRLWLLDAAAVRPGLAPVPDRSLPTVTVGRLTLVEGDQSPVAAALPLHISGRVTTPAVLGIAAERTTFGEWTTTLVTVRLEPGQTTATALIPFEADELDDLPRQVQLVFAAPRVGVVTSGFTGLVRVRDDDPTPAVSVTASPARATYGQSLQFRLTLSEPVDYYVVNRVRAVPSPAGPSLRTSDVTAAWLRAQLGEAPDDVPLWRVWHWGFMDLPPGALVGTVTIPTRAHPVHRSTKWLTVEVNAQHLVRGATATARVALP